MTPAQEMYQRRLAALNQLKRSGGDGGGLLGLLAGGAPVDTTGPTSVPLDAEQGPAMGGGLLHKGPSAPAAAGRGITAPGKTHFFIKGRGPTIDFGPIFKPRSTGADPMQGDPFKATDGVGGFFRRLLGDNSDELNSEWQKMRMERSMNLSDKAEDRAAKAEEIGADQAFRGQLSADELKARTDLQKMQQAWAGEQADKDRTFKEGLTQKELDNRRTIQELENSGRFLTSLMYGRGGGSATPRGAQMKEAGKVYTDENGKEYSYYVGENDRLIRYNLDGSEAPTEQGAPDENALNFVRQRFNALRSNDINAAAPKYGVPTKQPLVKFNGGQSTTSAPTPAIIPGLPGPDQGSMTLQDLLKRKKSLVELLTQ